MASYPRGALIVKNLNNYAKQIVAQLQAALQIQVKPFHRFSRGAISPLSTILPIRKFNQLNQRQKKHKAQRK